MDVNIRYCRTYHAMINCVSMLQLYLGSFDKQSHNVRFDSQLITNIFGL